MHQWCPPQDDLHGFQSQVEALQKQTALDPFADEILKYKKLLQSSHDHAVAAHATETTPLGDS